MSAENKVLWIYEIQDKATKFLDDFGKKEDELAEKFRVSKKEQFMAYRQRSNLIKDEMQDLKELQQRARLAHSPEVIEQYNKRIAETERRIKTIRSVSPMAGNALSKMWSKASVALNGYFKATVAMMGMRGIGQFFSTSIKGFDVQQKAIASVNASIQSTGGIAGKTLQELEQQASDLQKKTLFGDEAILSAQGVLLSFTNIRGAIYDKAMPAILDMSQKMGTELKSSVMQVGKALQDPAKGFSALSESGVKFSEDQKKSIEKLVAAGKVQEAQQIILNELQRQFGGSAAAAAKTGLGAWQQLGNAFGDTKEQMGGVIVQLVDNLRPALEWVNSLLSSFLSFLQEHPGVVKGVLIALGGLATLLAFVNIKAWILNQTLNLNPFVRFATLAIAAISLIVANWDDVVGFFKVALNVLLMKVKKFGEDLKWFLTMPFRLLRGVIEKVIPGAKEPIQRFVNWIKEKFDKLFGWISRGWQKMKSFFGFGDNGESSSEGDKRSREEILAAMEKAQDGFLERFKKMKTDEQARIAQVLSKKFGIKISATDINTYMNDRTKAKAKGMSVEEYRKQFGGSDKYDLGDKINGVSESAERKDIRNNNVRIENLVREFKVIVNNLGDSPARIKEAISEALVDAVRDTEIALNT